MKQNIKNYGSIAAVAVLVVGSSALAVANEKYRSSFVDFVNDVAAGYVAGVAANQTTSKKKN